MLVQIYNQIADNALVLGADFGVKGVNVFAVHSKIHHNIMAVAGFAYGVGEFLFSQLGFFNVGGSKIFREL